MVHFGERKESTVQKVEIAFSNPNDWILLTNDDIGFVVKEEDGGLEEEISVSEDAKSFREEQASMPASEEKLQMELEMPPSQVMTRSKMPEGKGGSTGPLRNTIWSRKTCSSAPKIILKVSRRRWRWTLNVMNNL